MTSRRDFLRTAIGAAAVAALAPRLVFGRAAQPAPDDTEMLDALLLAGGTIPPGVYRTRHPIQLRQSHTIIKGSTFIFEPSASHMLGWDAGLSKCEVMNCHFVWAPPSFGQRLVNRFRSQKELHFAHKSLLLGSGWGWPA